MTSSVPARLGLALLVAFAALPALAQTSPFGVGLPEQGGGLLPWLAGLQKQFYRDMTAALGGMKQSGAAFWWLAGLSFAYGVVHAAGPGHGKVVISSYLLANEASARRGVWIAFLAAVAQAAVAILVVAVMAAFLNMTSFAITDAARLLEIGSYALIAGLGLALLARKARRAWHLARPADAGPRHGHDHGDGCCHGHVPAPQAAERGRGAGGAAAAVASVGLRPCTGALVVLVFALAQGMFWAGIVSTVLMALGTALTIAALAALAVGAKDVAARLAGGTGRAAAVMLGLETLAALAVFGFGAALLAGALAA